MQDPHVTEDLRGIDYVGGGVAWASGSHGTVLRTEDMGFVWQLCATPPDAKDLDFRGVQAFDNNTAIVMSSGPGDKSRLFKTTDGCQTWTLLFTNPDQEGFWDAIKAKSERDIRILGDPVQGHFRLYESEDNDLHWFQDDAEPDAAHDGAFAASNTSLIDVEESPSVFFGTGGVSGARLFRLCPSSNQKPCWTALPMPMFPASASGGIFSLASNAGWHGHVMLAVGGDYLKADLREKNAAYSSDFGAHWSAAVTPPHGFRSAVAYDVNRVSGSRWVRTAQMSRPMTDGTGSP